MKPFARIPVLVLATVLGALGCNEEDDNQCTTSGNWYDGVSRFCWQDPPAVDSMEWEDAIAYCEGLELGGRSDWRLPSISELRSLVRGCPDTEWGGACGVRDDCAVHGCWNHPCSGCDEDEGPGADGCYWDPALRGGCMRRFWTSTPYPTDDEHELAWIVYFVTGAVHHADQTSEWRVRCVRTGS